MEYIIVSTDWMNEVSAKLDQIQKALEHQKPEPAANKALSAKEVAKQLGVTQNTVYAWAREGKIRSVSVGNRVLFPETAVQELMKGGE